MDLTFEQIQSIAMGAVRAEKQNDAVCLYRFTQEQETVYQARNSDFYQKTFATAGIRLDFLTNSSELTLETEVAPASSRSFFSFDIYQNGTLIGQLGSPNENCGRFSASFSLTEGEKHILIYFPWSVAAKLRRLALSDGAWVMPVHRPHKMLIYGDSITHGYDAMFPSRSYTSLLADALQANAYNKGIGGETFFPALAELSDDIEPDYISVAYGTNDWSKKEKEALIQDGTAFFHALSQRNPKAEIFAITPIWRTDWENTTAAGNFSDLPLIFHEITASLPNVHVIHGFHLVPHHTEFFQDRFVHPNDEGFSHYFTNLYREIQAVLDPKKA